MKIFQNTKNLKHHPHSFLFGKTAFNGKGLLQAVPGNVTDHRGIVI